MKRALIISGFAGLWILGFFYCQQEKGSADRSPVNTDSLIEAQLNDTLLLGHSRLEPVEDTTQGVYIETFGHVDTIIRGNGHSITIRDVPAGHSVIIINPR